MSSYDVDAFGTPPITITGTFTVDNCYQVWTGDINGPTEVGHKIIAEECNSSHSQIMNGETFSFDYVPGSYIYITAWSDDKVLQGMVGSFTGGITLSTGDSRIKVIASGVDFDTNEYPSVTDIRKAIQNGNWENVFVGPLAYEDPNPIEVYEKLNMPNLASTARWIWYDSGNDPNTKWPDGKVPFAGYNHEEFLIFRIPVDELLASFDPCCPPWNSDRITDMMSYEGSGGIAAPYTFVFNPTQQFKNQIQSYINYVHMINSNADAITIHWRLHDKGDGPLPSSLGNGPVIAPEKWLTWCAGGNGEPCNGPINFWGGIYPMEVNHWYMVHTGIYLHNGIKFFPEDCASNDTVPHRITVGQKLRQANFEVSDGKSIKSIRSLDIMPFQEAKE